MLVGFVVLILFSGFLGWVWLICVFPGLSILGEFGAFDVVLMLVVL